MAQFLEVFLLVTAFLLHTLIIGFGALRFVLGNSNNIHAEAARRVEPISLLAHAFFAICLGLLIDILVLFALGLGGMFERSAVLWSAGLLLMGSVATMALRRHRWAPNATINRFDATSGIEAVVLAVIYLASIITAFHPPGMWDDTLYQLPLAQLYVDEQGIVFSEYIRYSLFPQHANLLMALGLMFEGVIYAQALASIPMFVLAVGLAAFSQRLTGSSAVGLLAAASLFVIGPLVEPMGYAYVDTALALFCWAAVFAGLNALHCDPARTNRWLALAGLFAGAAMGIKLLGAAVAAVLGLALCWQLRRRPPRELAVSAAWYIGAVLLAGAGWYIRSAIISGDPVHPAGAQIFGYFLWNEVDYAWQRSQVVRILTHNPLRLFEVLDASGVILWLPAFIGIAFWRFLSANVRYLYAVLLLYFVFWFFVTQIDRYLAPVAALCAFLSVFMCYQAVRLGIAWGVEKAGRRPEQTERTGSVLLAILALAASVHVLALEARNSREHMLHWNGFLAAQPGYTLFQRANRLTSEYGSRMVQIGFEASTFYFKGTAIGDWFGVGRYWDLMHCTDICGTMFDSATMEQLMHKHGARILVFGRHMDKGFDPSSYQDRFRIVYEDDEGVLMVLKNGG